MMMEIEPFPKHDFKKTGLMVKDKKNNFDVD
jgi:hypothetical protein